MASRWRWAIVVVFLCDAGADLVDAAHASRSRSCPRKIPDTSSRRSRRRRARRSNTPRAVAKQAEQIIGKDPDVLATFSVMGFSFSGASSNTGLMFVRLKPYSQRKGPDHVLQAVLRRVSGPLFSIPGAIVVSFNPPAIPGLSRFGGFEFQVLDQTGTNIDTLAQGLQAVVAAGNQSPKLRGLFSPFTANDPQLQVTIDRQRALALGLPLGEITSAMQVFLGSQYVNDFEFNNRAYRVYVQADQRYRSNPQALKQLYARARSGDMIPLEQVVQPERDDGAAGHQSLQPVPCRDDQRIGGAWRELGRRAEGNGAHRRAAPAAGHGLRLVGNLARGNEGRPAVAVHLRPGADPRVPDAGRAVREPGAALHRASRRSARGAWRTGRAVDARTVERRLLPGRAGHADRPGGKERDPDRRVCRAASRQGSDGCRRRDRSRRASACARF